jgi:hypothetical protein
MMTIKGGCLCGDIRYESRAAPVLSAVCHCTQCQKQSGSAFSTNLVVPAEAFRLTTQVPARFDDVGGSGLGVKRHFCGRCGSPVYTELEAQPGVVVIKAGTLDDPAAVSPQIHIWRRSAQPWIAAPDGVACFEENPAAPAADTPGP